MTINVLVIDPTARSISLCAIDKVYPDVCKIIGGHLGHALDLPNGDTLWVDDEGFLKRQTGFFSVPGCPTLLAGIAVLSGPEAAGGNTDDVVTLDVQTSPGDLLARITWLDTRAFARWRLANSREPAVKFFTFGTDGSAEERTIVTFGDLTECTLAPDDGEAGA